MGRATRTILLGVIFFSVTAILHISPDTGLAQDSAEEAVLGTWEGNVIQGASRSSARLELYQEGKAVRWKWMVSGGRLEAEGTVSRWSGPSLEVSGAYTSHPDSRIVGSAVTMSLTVGDNTMHGAAISARVNRPFTLSLTRSR